MIKHGYILLFMLIMIPYKSDAQDLNHYKSLSVCSYFHKYDSLNRYYFYYQVGFNDNVIGISQREYIAPDTLAGYIDYMSLIRDENGKSTRKGIFYEMFPNGVFFGLGYLDWRGERHGNEIHFRYDGTIKENKLYNRGVLLDRWKYNQAGELIEHIKYHDK